MKVLVVDDSDLDRERIRRYLIKQGIGKYTISESSSASECLDLLKQEKFDCVLLDYRLPDMTGLEILDNAEDNNLEGSAVILLTGAGNELTDLKAETLGALDYLIKDEISSSLLDRSIRYAVKVKSGMNKLVHANRVKDDFMAAMSHEMRTPLNAIINFSNHMMEGIYGEINEDHQKILDRIHRAGLHLSSLVESVLTTMSFQRDNVELNKENFNLAEELAFVIELCEPSLKEKDLQFEVSQPNSIPMLGDKARTRQILLNVIGNAIKFSETGTIKISVQIENEEVCINVTDPGMGIPEEQIEKVLEPFYQVEGTLSRRFGGLGLGLAISQKFVKLHGGKLLLESKEGQGTSVTIQLPVADSNR